MLEIPYANVAHKMTPIDGDTCDAFAVTYDGQRVFLKRNLSPLVPYLSNMNITPRILWSTVTPSGDRLVAQKWCNGFFASKDDMLSPKFIQLIKRIHTSHPLKNFFCHLEHQTKDPHDFITEYYENIPDFLKDYRFLNRVIEFLEDSLDDTFYEVEYAVCHGDLHHRNFLISEDDHLYLVDWENAHLADPMSDITWLLCQYADPSEWRLWLEQYGFEESEPMYKRTLWYGMMNCLRLMKHHVINHRYDLKDERLILLRFLYEKAIRQQRHIQ